MSCDCVICGADVLIADAPLQGELIECGSCGTDLEVTALEPLQLQEAPTEGEDWGE